jgi:hypothetical protein
MEGEKIVGLLTKFDFLKAFIRSRWPSRTPMDNSMDVRIESLLEGTARASGVVVIIDVLRAFTTAAVAFAKGATRITMVASVEEALVLRQQGAGQICMGEVGGRPPKRRRRDRRKSGRS